MNESERLAFNGHWWLFTLNYGTQKSLDVREIEKRYRGKGALTLLKENGDDARAAMAKLEIVTAELSSLLHTEVAVTPLDTEQVRGIVHAFDLNSGSIDIAQGGEIASVQYCSIIRHRIYGFEVTPIITLQAEKEYKF